MTKDAMPEEKMQEEQMPEEKTSDTSSAHVQTQIKFSGKAMGQHKAEFTWEIPEDMAAQAEKYVVIRSTDPEPTYPASWWWWRGPAHHDLTWEDLPEGKAYFRLCVLKGETCLEYSNPLELTIQ
ncbi:MAG: hypothetical protein COV59_01915 [Candidatus Magasanikbacteria bacterium CG11_big_fil_rev_8_21_14_0_20_39_34]|uniref:Fibronectin type-III domain-containing protein n=1 Tax=Candidatus Magasanikbacteria bacterium CG11_big_fil_rev_8_21_14_0_20_39_34 TaxID=1974653 RepID=A0A2H0N4V5_9BACT|nr:MAG: hypothetical protein COV59_01915 [Candidatus Magasanikbacteria bacterium CG11_big_fil_rev_8_21_14_0_20_39_34]